MASTATEIEMLRQAQAGDHTAFERLRARLEPPVGRFVRRLIGSVEVAEDIVQDAFLAFFNNLPQVRSDLGLRPYLFRIARNLCYDELRRQGRFQPLSADFDTVELRVPVGLPGAVAAEPEEVAHWLTLYLQVQQAMERLPEIQRQALLLYSEEELSYAQIAEVTGSSIGTVKSRIFYAKKALRQLMEPDTLRELDAALREEG